MTAWDDLIKEEGRIRKARKKLSTQEKEQKRQIRDYTIIGITSLIGCKCNRLDDMDNQRLCLIVLIIISFAILFGIVVFAKITQLK